jgi:hypothetical protein
MFGFRQLLNEKKSGREKEERIRLRLTDTKKS